MYTASEKSVSEEPERTTGEPHDQRHTEDESLLGHDGAGAPRGAVEGGLGALWWGGGEVGKERAAS